MAEAAISRRFVCTLCRRDIEVEPGRNRRKFCDTCNPYKSKLTWPEYLSQCAAEVAERAKTKARVCETCGQGFTQGRLSAKQLAAKHVSRFCSDPCRVAATKVHENKQAAKRHRYRRLKAEAGLPPVWEPIERSCSLCSQAFTAKTSTSRKCASCLTTRPKLTRPCLGCGSPVKGTAAKRYCEPCRRKRSKVAHRALHGRVRKHRDRARKHGVEYEPIQPRKVFERDGWRCQMCGIKTPERLRGTFKPNAPELDHRIPMAMGGPHTWANVQCSCRACNLVKGGTRAEGQMALFCQPA